MTNKTSNKEAPRDAAAYNDDPPTAWLTACGLGLNVNRSEALRGRGHTPTLPTLKRWGVIGENLDIGRDGSWERSSMLKEMLTHNGTQYFQERVFLNLLMHYNETTVSCATQGLGR